LGEPLGLSVYSSKKQSFLFIVRLDLVADDSDMVSFHQLLFKCMKKVYGNIKQSKELQQTEIKTLYELYLKDLSLETTTAVS